MSCHDIMLLDKTLRLGEKKRFLHRMIFLCNNKLPLIIQFPHRGNDNNTAVTERQSYWFGRVFNRVLQKPRRPKPFPDAGEILQMFKLNVVPRQL